MRLNQQSRPVSLLQARRLYEAWTGGEIPEGVSYQSAWELMCTELGMARAYRLAVSIDPRSESEELAIKRRGSQSR